MNRLKGSLFYISGAMDRVPDGGIEWRVWITPKLKEFGIGVLNPCDKPLDIAQENQNTRKNIQNYKNGGWFDEVRRIMKPITNIDLRLIDVCSAVIVYLDTDVHTAGTNHEMALAIMQKKPVLIMCKQGKAGIPNWWFGITPHELFFSSWDELFVYLNHIDKDEKVDDLNRWRFINFEKVF